MRRNTVFWTYAFLRWTRSFADELLCAPENKTSVAGKRKEASYATVVPPEGSFPFHIFDVWLPSGLTGGPGSY